MQTVSSGGSIVSSSGEHDCGEAQICELDIPNGQSFTDTFTALPRYRYGIAGWRGTESYLCAGSEPTCVVDIPASVTVYDATVSAAVTALLGVTGARACSPMPWPQRPAQPTLPDGVTADSVCTYIDAPRPSCWIELYNLPGCYVWNPDPQPNETASWSGRCAYGFANGTGIVTWINGANRENETIDDPGPYLNGKRHGTWTVHSDEGTVIETPYVNGEKHGTEVRSYSDGQVAEVPYVNGRQRGTVVWRYPDGTIGYRCYRQGEIQFVRCPMDQ